VKTLEAHLYGSKAGSRAVNEISAAEIEFLAAEKILLAAETTIFGG